MGKLDFLKKIYGFIKTPNIESLNLSMANTHYEGMFSLVVNGTEYGKLTRIFIADNDLQPYKVQLHTHRYPLRLTTIKGNIKHHVAINSEIVDSYTISLSEYTYKSPLNGGGGLAYDKESNFITRDYSLPICSTLQLTENDFHTISCDKGSIWVVEELGFVNDFSRVLGVPFVLDGLYTPPASFQINDKCQYVAKEIKKLILDYELV